MRSTRAPERSRTRSPSRTLIWCDVRGEPLVGAACADAKGVEAAVVDKLRDHAGDRVVVGRGAVRQRELHGAEHALGGVAHRLPFRARFEAQPHEHPLRPHALDAKSGGRPADVVDELAYEYVLVASLQSDLMESNEDIACGLQQGLHLRAAAIVVERSFASGACPDGSSGWLAAV